MTAITSGDDFIQAVNEWKKTHIFQGTPYFNAGDRKIFDETPDPTPELPGHVRYIDVTPAAAVLEAALDTAIAQQAAEQERATARAALQAGIVYLQTNLPKAVPPTPAQFVSVFKPIIDGNGYLTNMMTNLLSVMNLAFGTTATLNPTTQPTRAQYIMACKDVIVIMNA